MVSFKVILSSIALSSAVLAAPQTDYTGLCYTDITNIDNTIKELTAKVKDFSGSIFEAVEQIPLFLEATVATASAGLHSSFLARPLPVDDLLRLADHVNKTLAVDSPLAMQALVSKEPEYDETGFKDPILLGLKAYLILCQQVAKNILDRVPAGAPKKQSEGLKSNLQMITDTAQKAIEVFE